MDDKVVGRIEERLIQLQTTADDTHELVRTQGIELAKQGEQLKDAFRQIKERVTLDKHEALARRVEENRNEKLDADAAKAITDQVKAQNARLDKIEGWIMKGLWAIVITALGAVASIIMTLVDKA